MKFVPATRLTGALMAGVGLAVLGFSAITASQAQSPQPLKIGLLGGLSGVYADVAQGQVEAMQLAVDDVGGKVLGRPIEIVSAE